MGADLHFWMRDNPHYGQQLVTGEEMYLNFLYLMKTDLDIELKEWKDLTDKERNLWNKTSKFYSVYK